MCHDGSVVMAVSSDGHGCRALSARIAGCVPWRVTLLRGRNFAPSFKRVVQGGEFANLLAANWSPCLQAVVPEPFADLALGPFRGYSLHPHAPFV